MPEIILPPGPKTPQLLRTLKLVFRPLDYMDTYAKQYGDFFTVGSKKTPFVYVNHPQAIREIFTAVPETFLIGQGNRSIGFLLGENSLLRLDGPRHQRQRRLLMPPFGGDRLQTYSRLIVEITQQVTRQWQVGKRFAVRATMQEITLKVILQVVFGIHEVRGSPVVSRRGLSDQGQRYEQLRQLLSQLLDAMSSPVSSVMLFFPSLQQDWVPLSPWGRFKRFREQVDRLIYQEIAERRHSDLAGDDILSLLMLARDEAGQSMSDEELRDELMTLLVAGHETTASALAWAFYWIHYLPQIQDKLRHELDACSNEPGELSQLPYLDAVCSETLRLYPIAVIAFPRILQVPFKLMSYQLPAGTVLVPCIYLVHQREEIYPEPKRFRPERFLERQFSSYEYLPFGGGNRRCIGMALARLEMKLVLATLLSRFRMRLSDPRPIKPIRRGLTIAPPNQFKMAIAQLQ